MAIKKCKECQHPVSTKAEACPSCGAVTKKRKSGCIESLVAVVLLIFGIGFIGSIIGGSGSGSSRSSTTNTPSEPTLPATSDVPKPVVTPTPTPTPPTPKNWRYSHSDYAMGKGRVHNAATLSTNSVSFSFPYAGAQRGTLFLRTHPEHGKDIILSIERGQFLVRSYEDDIALVRFDDGDPISCKVVGAEDHSTTSVFFRDYHGFVERMLKSKRVRISVPVYQEGSPVFEFAVSDFDTKAYLEDQK